MVLSFPFDRRVSIAVSPRRDSSIRFYASDLNERKRTNLANLKFKREDRWANFIKAAVASCAEAGHASRGLNVTLCGDIPQGLGLGSATALRCAATIAVALGTDWQATSEEVLGSLVDSDGNYFNRPGFPALYASTLSATAGHMTFVDAKDNSSASMPMRVDDCRMFLIDTKVPRPPLDGEIQMRSDDCDTGLEILNGSGSRVLRDFSVDELDEYLGVMPERIRRHCVFHIEELQRVRDAREAILHADYQSLYRLLNKSMTGLRNHYEISCPEVDWLVKRGQEIPGVLATRLLGRGFGGAVLAILENRAVSDFTSRIEEYERIFGFHAGLLEISSGTGMMVQ